MRSDGSQTTRLTDDPAFDDSPALSPGGAQIAFLTARHDPKPQFPDLKYELYVMDSDGSNVRRLTTTEAAEDHPAWSPDGSRIIFDADYDGDGRYEIYTINPDGTDVTRLTANQANDQFADWSPDGAQIAFSSDRNGNWDIFVMDADGGNQRPLTSSPDWELFPAWSPDGTLIAFNGLVPRSRNTDVFVMRADGSDARQLTDSPRFDENPAWSPDGSLIAFQTERDGNFEIYVMNSDGSEQRPLVASSSDELWPSWKPASSDKASAGAVLLIFGQRFIPDIYTVVRPALEEAGYRVVVASRAPDALKAKNTNLEVEVDLLLEDVRVEDYDAILFNCDNDITCGSARAETNRIAQESVAQGKVLAAICSGPRVLAEAQVVEGKQTTGEPSQTCQMLEKSGATCTGAQLERDGRLITARDRSASRAYVQAIIEALQEPPATSSTLPFSLEKSTQTFDDRGTFQAALGDLDGDGDLDAVFANPLTHDSAVWLNDGGIQGGTPGAFTNTGQKLTRYGHGVGVADFDGDGDLDAAIACHQFRTPSKVYLNDGGAQGGTPGQFSDSGQPLNPTLGADLVAGDLDGDGDMDVVVTNMDLPDEVWLNDGQGNFTDSGLRLGEGAHMSTKASLGDLDGDGDLDILIGSLNGMPEIWLNAAAGDPQ